MRQVVSSTGTLQAVVTVQVGSQVSGTIDKLLADFNTKVNAGQVVAQLNQDKFKAAVDKRGPMFWRRKRIMPKRRSAWKMRSGLWSGAASCASGS